MSQVYKETLRELDARRLRAENDLAARQDFLYEKLPGIREIDREMAEIGLKIAKSAIKPGLDADNAENLRKRGEELALKREGLLYDNGYDASFFEDVYGCAACKDTGFVGSGRCACVKQRLIAKYYEMSNLAQILDKENFDTFDLGYYSTEVDKNHGISPRDNIQRIWTASLKFVEDFDTKFENLMLYGATGLGKTFLSNCIAKELLDAGKTVLYTTAAALFKLVEDQRFNRNGAKSPAYLDMILDVDLLIIDDLGTEFSTVVTTSELFNFINTRLLAKKSTIISTNLDPADFEEQYSDRITSRLFGEYMMLRFFGDDIRVAKKFGRR